MAETNQKKANHRKFSSGERLTITALFFFTVMILGFLTMLITGKMVILL